MTKSKHIWAIVTVFLLLVMPINAAVDFDSSTAAKECFSPNEALSARHIIKGEGKYDFFWQLFYGEEMLAENSEKDKTVSGKSAWTTAVDAPESGYSPGLYNFEMQLSSEGETKTRSFEVKICGDVKTEQKVEESLPAQKIEMLENGVFQVTAYESQLVKIRPKASDAEGDTLTYTFSSPLNENGEWQTKVGDAGEYETKLTVSDGKSETSQNIKIVLLKKNSPPLLRVDNIVVREGELAKAKVFTSDAENDKVTLTFSSPLNENGEWQTKEGDAGKQTSTVVASDGNSKVVQEITVTVVGKKDTLVETQRSQDVPLENVAPTIKSLPDVVVKENELAVLKLDVEDLNGDDLIITIDKLFNEDLKWWPTYDDAGEYVVKVIISDGKLEVSQDVKVTVLDVDRAPAITPVPAAEVKELEVVSFDVVAEDLDKDEITLTVALPQDAIFKEGKFTWTPSQGASYFSRNIFFKLVDSIGLRSLWPVKRTYNIKIKACGKQACSEEIAKITVHDINRVPQLEDIPDITIKEGDNLKLNPKAPDLDNDHVYLTFTYPLNANGVWTPSYNATGSYKVTATASDLVEAMSKDFNINVENNNRAPAIDNKIKEKITLKEGQKIEFKVETSDADGDVVTLSLKDPPVGASLEGNTFTWKPAASAASVADIPPQPEPSKWQKLAMHYGLKENNLVGKKEHKIVIEAYDGISTTPYEVLFDIVDENQAPEIIQIFPAPEVSVYAGHPIPFNVTAVDPDGDKLTYEWNVAGATESGTYAVFDQIGLQEIQVIVSDGDKSTDFVWTVDVLQQG